MCEKKTGFVLKMLTHFVDFRHSNWQSHYLVEFVLEMPNNRAEEREIYIYVYISNKLTTKHQRMSV